MFDKDLKLSSECFSEEQFVSYLYNEMDESERTGLDEHLAICVKCTDEFADLSEPRFSVYRWQTSEFVEMPTPVISGPWENVPVRSIKPIEVDSPTWIAGVLAALRRPALAFSIPALVVAGLIGGVYLNRNAGSGSKNAKTTSVESVLPVTQNQPPVAQVAGDDKIKAAESHPRANEDPKTKATILYAKAAKVSNPRQSIKTEIASINTPAKSLSNRKAPRLGDFDEEEDSSVRLSDLLAESDRDRDR